MPTTDDYDKAEEQRAAQYRRETPLLLMIFGIIAAVVLGLLFRAHTDGVTHMEKKPHESDPRGVIVVLIVALSVVAVAALVALFMVSP